MVVFPFVVSFIFQFFKTCFVIDIFVGWIYALAVFYFGSKLLDRWEARRMRKDLETGQVQLGSLDADAPLVPSS